MSNEAKKPLTLGRGKLELKKTVETVQVRQSFSHGRSKVVQGERKMLLLCRFDFHLIRW